MIAALALLLAAPPDEPIIGTLDDRPPAIVAEGLAAQLEIVRDAGLKCGFSRAWVSDDGTADSQLWVLASEVSPARTACLRRRKAKARARVRWTLPGLRGR